MSSSRTNRPRRAAEDDPIAAKKAQADHEAQLLRYWEERVRWWKDPKPPRKTPKSGLFESAARTSSGVASASRHGSRVRAAAVESNAMTMDEEAAAPMAAAPAPQAERAVRKSAAGGRADGGKGPSVTLKAWNPKTPYVEALKAAPKGGAYAVYLKERETYRDSPAFYLDCAGWFFTEGETETALRVISNLAEFRLENVALWRTMGWRLREAALTGATTAQATVYTDWGTDREKMQILTLRLDKPKDKVTVGEVRLD